MNNYILSRLGSIKANSFIVDFNLYLSAYSRDITAIAKIDTGCEKTSISLRAPSIRLSLNECHKMKQFAIDNNFYSELGFGANDSLEFKSKQKELFKSRDLFNCSVIKFDNPVSTFSINNYSLPVSSIGVSYDRVSNVLIGMDILRLLDFHCGLSKVDDVNNGIRCGDYIFIACLCNDMNNEYIHALEKYLGITTNSTIFASITRKLLSSWHMGM